MYNNVVISKRVDFNDAKYSDFFSANCLNPVGNRNFLTNCPAALKWENNASRVSAKCSRRTNNKLVCLYGLEKGVFEEVKKICNACQYRQK